MEYIDYGMGFMIFCAGFICGYIALKTARQEKEISVVKKELQKVCGHKDSRFEDLHPEFPWTCHNCRMNHNGLGVNQN